jgi:hypothetical protein
MAGKERTSMRRHTSSLGLLVLVIVIAACTSSGTATPTGGVVVPGSAGPTVASSTAPATVAAEPLGTPSAAAWCAFVIDVNTRHGYMTNLTYASGAPSVAQQQAILAETMARQAYWLSVTPPDVLAATQAELAYYTSLATWTAANGWTNLAAAPTPTTTQVTLIQSLVPYQEQQCGIKFGGS